MKINKKSLYNKLKKNHKKLNRLALENSFKVENRYTGLGTPEATVKFDPNYYLVGFQLKVIESLRNTKIKSIRAISADVNNYSSELIDAFRQRDIQDNFNILLRCSDYKYVKGI